MLSRRDMVSGTLSRLKMGCHLRLSPPEWWQPGLRAQSCSHTAGEPRVLHPDPSKILPPSRNTSASSIGWFQMCWPNAPGAVSRGTWMDNEERTERLPSGPESAHLDEGQGVV